MSEMDLVSKSETIWDKTVYITDNAVGRKLVFSFTHSLAEHVANMSIPNNAEITLTA